MHVVAKTTAFQCLSRGVYLWRGIQRQSFMVSAAEVIVLLRIKTRARFLCSAGVVSRTTGLALQDRWGLDRAALLTLESRWTSHSQHHWVPCKCEAGVRMVTRIHVLRSVFMHKLVWFQLLLARKEGESENSQTPEPSLTTPAPPPPPTRSMYSAWFHCRLPVSILSYKMLENLSNTGGTSGAALILGV